MFLRFCTFQQIKTKVELEDESYSTEMFDLTFNDLEEHNISRFSVTGFEVSMARVATPFFINTYVPSGVLTMISFIGFVIPVDKVP